MSIYRAVYEREPDGSAWNVTFPDVPGCFTWGRTLRQAENRARDAVACHLDVDTGSVELEHDVRLPRPAAEKAVRKALEARRRLAVHQAEAADATAKAARALIEAGLTQRDAAAVLGLSHQRINQLVG